MPVLIPVRSAAVPPAREKVESWRKVVEKIGLILMVLNGITQRFSKMVAMFFPEFQSLDIC